MIVHTHRSLKMYYSIIVIRDNKNVAKSNLTVNLMSTE